jgi:endonuclease/exonuclease/phosphatase family metal-dependent hydrolase
MASTRLRGDRIATSVRWIAIFWIALVFGVLLITILWPQRSGPLAMAAIFGPYLAISALLAIPFALIGQSARAQRAVLVGLAAVLTVGLASSCWSLPSTATKALSVAAWNIEWGPGGADRVVTGLTDVNSDIVGLEELQPNMAARIDADPSIQTRWPHRALGPDPTVNGVGLLSRWPIVEQFVSSDPPYLRAVVAGPDANRTIVVYVVHPTRGDLESVARVPVSIDNAERDAAIGEIRTAVAADVDAGRTVLVVGDINTTEREPAYSDLSAGMQDAQRDAGRGLGLTWRPHALNAPPFGLLRIDYIFSTPDLRASSYDVECTSLSDHCIVLADLGST